MTHDNKTYHDKNDIYSKLLNITEYLKLLNITTYLVIPTTYCKSQPS